MKDKHTKKLGIRDGRRVYQLSLPGFWGGAGRNRELLSNTECNNPLLAIVIESWATNRQQNMINQIQKRPTKNKEEIQR